MTDSSQKPGMAAHATLVIGLAIALLIVYYAIWPGSHRPNDPVSQRYRNALEIGNALRHYRDDHRGELPVRLADLFPHYIDASNVDWCLLPYKHSGPTPDHTPALEQISMFIESNGVFIYLGTKGIEANLVLYDCPSLWPKDANTPGVVTLRATNLAPILLAVTEVEDKLKSIK